MHRVMSWTWRSPKGRITGRKESVEGRGWEERPATRWHTERRGPEPRCVFTWQGLYDSVLSKPSGLCTNVGGFHGKLNRNKTRREKVSVSAKPGMFSEGKKRHISKQYTQNDPLHVWKSKYSGAFAVQSKYVHDLLVPVPALGWNNKEAFDFFSLRFHRHVRYYWYYYNH